MQWPGVWCSPGADGAAGYGESGMVTAGFFFFDFSWGYFFGNLEVGSYIPPRPIAYKMLTSIRLYDYNIS